MRWVTDSRCPQQAGRDRVLPSLNYFSALPLEQIAYSTRGFFLVVGAAFVLVNYVLLAAAYKRGDLSVIYPVVRGAILVFLPPLAYITLSERLEASRVGCDRDNRVRHCGVAVLETRSAARFRDSCYRIRCCFRVRDCDEYDLG